MSKEENKHISKDINRNFCQHMSTNRDKKYLDGLSSKNKSFTFSNNIKTNEKINLHFNTFFQQIFEEAKNNEVKPAHLLPKYLKNNKDLTFFEKQLNKDRRKQLKVEYKGQNVKIPMNVSMINEIKKKLILGLDFSESSNNNLEQDIVFKMELIFNDTYIEKNFEKIPALLSMKLPAFSINEENFEHDKQSCLQKEEMNKKFSREKLNKETKQQWKDIFNKLSEDLEKPFECKYYIALKKDGVFKKSNEP